MGLGLGEIFDLDTLADDCAADGRYTFMLAAAPLTITGAVGSPVAPWRSDRHAKDKRLAPVRLDLLLERHTHVAVSRHDPR